MVAAKVNAVTTMVFVTWTFDIKLGNFIVRKLYNCPDWMNNV